MHPPSSRLTPSCWDPRWFLVADLQNYRHLQALDTCSTIQGLSERLLHQHMPNLVSLLLIL